MYIENFNQYKSSVGKKQYLCGKSDQIAPNRCNTVANMQSMVYTAGCAKERTEIQAARGGGADRNERREPAGTGNRQAGCEGAGEAWAIAVRACKAGGRKQHIHSGLGAGRQGVSVTDASNQGGGHAGCIA